MHRIAAALLASTAGVLPAVAQNLPPIQAPSAANPYGLGALWAQGDIVSRLTLVVLVVMSVASWYVLVRKLLAQSRLGGQGRAANASSKSSPAAATSGWSTRVRRRTARTKW